MSEKELMDCADLIEIIADPLGMARGDEIHRAQEQFRAQLIRVIDERVAIALEKRFPVITTAGEPVKQVLGDIQKMLTSIEASITGRDLDDAPSGMYDPRG